MFLFLNGSDRHHRIVFWPHLNVFFCCFHRHNCATIRVYHRLYSSWATSPYQPSWLSVLLPDLTLFLVEAVPKSKSPSCYGDFNQFALHRGDNHVRTSVRQTFCETDKAAYWRAAGDDFGASRPIGPFLSWNLWRAFFLGLFAYLLLSMNLLLCFPSQILLLMSN